MQNNSRERKKEITDILQGKGSSGEVPDMKRVVDELDKHFAQRENACIENMLVEIENMADPIKQMLDFIRINVGAAYERAEIAELALWLAVAPDYEKFFEVKRMAKELWNKNKRGM